MLSYDLNEWENGTVFQALKGEETERFPEENLLQPGLVLQT